MPAGHGAKHSMKGRRRQWVARGRLKEGWEMMTLTHPVGRRILPLRYHGRWDNASIR
jgi:hypothetical protein